MEPVLIIPECRGRKRRRKDMSSPMSSPRAKRKAGPTKGKIRLVGRYVRKDFGCSGIFLGKIIFYQDGLYRVDYEDGDCEDLDASEVKKYLVDDGVLDMARKSKLDELIINKNMKHVEGIVSDAKKVENIVLTETDKLNDVESIDDGDVSSDSLDHDLDGDLNSGANVVIVPQPQLPPSSGNIGVPEEYVSYLFSVYGFLRSFSIQLYLSPFGLDDFVGSLNCPLQNTLIDAIHVALMRVLKRHLELLASDGSKLALNRMRLTDWTLLDMLTWPIFLVQYLMIARHMSEPKWKGIYIDALTKNYYSLPAGWKLMILQILCDDVMESAEFRSEIDIREEVKIEKDTDSVTASFSETTPKREHPETYTKTADTNEEADIVDDDNGSECKLCGMDGTLLCCDGCPSTYHSRCIGVSKMSIPEGTWYCPECAINRDGLTIAKDTSLTGAEIFGVDIYGQVYIGICDHLLVLEVSSNSETCSKYYNHKDIPKVLQSLVSTSQHVLLYSDICKAISRYWDIQKDVIIPFFAKVEIDEQSSEAKDNRQSLTPINIPGGENHKLLDIVDDKKVDGCITEKRYLKPSGDCVYMGLHYKPQVYQNNYSQGDFAASAAVHLAVLSAEEKEVTKSHSLDKRRKMALAENLLQIKAFSLAATRFFWPVNEKKLVEVPRERCGWCHSCKSITKSRKTCVLNAAASNATKGAMKILAEIPTTKNGDGRFCAIATYIIFMEESICGFMVGDFRNAVYRKQWRKRVEHATTWDAIKFALLELEGNIRSVALSPDWFELIESWLIESSVTQSTITGVGPTKKRYLSRRQGRTPAAVSASESDGKTVTSADFTWWRGGIFSKLILQRGVLPRSVIKKASRQGGFQSIPEIVYAEGCEIPKRSRQLFWRAAVEMSKNAAEFALQVRRLDRYIRWNDLIHPEQTLQDGKSQDAEALDFRNGNVCHKKIVEDKILYGVDFGVQKHLPSRVMKNIIEVEQSQNGKKKYWFSETKVPLYLIKEYEEKIDKMQLPLPEKPANVLSNLQKRQMKASRKDIFSYMSCKKDDLVKCSCASCQLDVLIRNALKCNQCEGFCHERCTIGSTNHKVVKVEHVITCKECNTKNLSRSEKELPTNSLLCQRKYSQKLVTPFHRPVEPVGLVNSSPLEMRLGGKSSNLMSKDRHEITAWGLIFKNKLNNKDAKSQEEKEKEDQDGLRFRMTHILRKDLGRKYSEGPKCYLCDLPYNPRLAYILCDSCMNWYHTDSLELQESKISQLVGFQCCKCRRIRSPVCPHSDPNKKRTLESKTKRLARKTKGSNSESDGYGPYISDQPKEIDTPSLLSPPKELVPCMAGHDPLLYSLSMDEQFSEPTSKNDITQWNCANTSLKTGSQKLQIRSLVNNDQGNFLDKAEEFFLHPSVEWDVSKNGSPFDFNDLNFEDMEFEPQTYFSLDELLSPDATNGSAMEGTNADTIYCGDVCIDDFEITYADSQIGLPEEHMGQELNTISAGIFEDIILCQVCSLADPSPDLWCNFCGMCLHSHCSPWVEQFPREGQWKCGTCREC